MSLLNEAFLRTAATFLRVAARMNESQRRFRRAQGYRRLKDQRITPEMVHRVCERAGWSEEMWYRNFDSLNEQGWSPIWIPKENRGRRFVRWLDRVLNQPRRRVGA